jgi:carbon-monoxide dehydrogenase large subunit
MAHIAARFLECSADAIVFRSGQVFDQRYPDQALTFSRVAAAAYRVDLIPPGMEQGLEHLVSFVLPENPFAFAAHIAIIEIDRSTGAVHFLRYAAVHDCGRVINPTLLAGQVHGAIAQGIGPALAEAMVYTPEGQPLTGSFLDYVIPSAADIPVIQLDIRETPSPTNPLGVKGIGELPTVAAPVAVANAVIDALAPFGVRHLDLLLTSEKIWSAMQGR